MHKCRKICLDLSPFLAKKVPDTFFRRTPLYLRRPIFLREKVPDTFSPIDENETQLKQQRAQILDHYATGALKQDEYLEKCFWLDNEAKKIKLQKSELIKRIPILHKKDVIDVSVRIFCETVRARFERLNNFDTKRQFCLDFIEEILYDHGKVTVKGFLPIQLQAYSDPDQSSEASRIEFSIEGSR